MGYQMIQHDSAFKIKQENFQEALATVRSLHGHETCGGWFSWVSPDFYHRTELVDILHDWRWEATRDEAGDIVELDFQGEKLGDERILFDALAPFVEPGSYLEMHGEDGSRWRWTFDGATMTEKTATISWD